jgi:tRNA pseudouridine32 synthase/23S rRNA pseudouridine746 synthase
MLFARGKEMQRRLSHAFAQREVHKEYIAVVDGLLAADRGEIDLPLLTDWPNRPKQKVDFADGKPALTRYTVLERDAARGTTRVLLEPVTGRSHQLRVHLLALGHPIAGDALYAPPDALAKAPRLLLHAQSLALPHPVDGRPLRFHSPAPF